MTLRITLQTLLATLLLAPFAGAGEPPLAKATPAFDDAKLALKIKSTLGADKDLASLNLFVSVLDRVAAIQGPVPSEAAKEKIKALAAAIPGVSDVKVDCFVVATDDPLKKEIASRLNPTNPTPKTEMPAAVPVATGGLPSVAVGPPVRSAIPKLPVTEDLPHPQLDNTTVTAQRPAEPLQPLIESGLLAAPVQAAPKMLAITPLPTAPTATRPYPTIPPPNVPVLPVGLKKTSADDIAFALVDVRKSDPRFAGLTVGFTNGVVTVSGHADYAEAYAAAVRHIVDGVRVDVK
jgi:hypothetical protein